MLNRLLERQYGLKVIECSKSLIGANSDTYFVTCADGRYVVKFPDEDSMSNPEIEVKMCEYLLKRGVLVSEYISNIDGDFLSKSEDGRMFHVQRFVDGVVYDFNKAPKWLLFESARMLGRIHTSLKDYVGLPEGIGSVFFEYMTPIQAVILYRDSLSKARERKEVEIEEDLMYRMGLMFRFPKYKIDVPKLTFQATHGDYFVNQYICGEDKIKAVIDWTSACNQPVVWEIMRAYVRDSESCIDGQINISEFVEYVQEYLKYATLSEYDIRMMPKVAYTILAVCDHYSKYYTSDEEHKGLYRKIAVFSTKLIKWFEEHIEELEKALESRFLSA